MAIKHITYKNNLYDINYEMLNQSQEQTIVFLHGWGSSKDIMRQAFYPYLKNYKHIYIDMPGFGKSFNASVLNTNDYANIIDIFLNKLNISSIDIAVGHSFGGKVATLLSPNKLVLLSSAGIIEEKSIKTLLTIRMAKIFNKCGLSKVTKLLRSKDVNMMPQNMYDTFKNVVDEDFSFIFESYSGATQIFWGIKDTATTLSSGHKIHKLIKNSQFASYDGDHYFFIKHSKEICDAIS